MSALASALLAELGPEDLRALAEALAPYLAPPAEDAWLGTREAAEHLGVSRSRLHRLTASRAIPFTQDVAGGKCHFRRSDLDAWRAR